MSSPADQRISASPRPEERTRPLKRLLPFLTRYPVRLTLTLAFLLIAALSALAIPALAGGLVDQGFVGQNLDMVSRYGWLILAIAALMAVANGARYYFVSQLGERVIADLREAVFEHLLRQDLAYFDRNRVGEFTSRLSGDIASIRGAVGGSLSVLLRGGVTLIGSVVLMFITSPYLAIAVVVIAPMLVVPVVAISRRLRKMSRTTQDALADMSAMATEMLSAPRAVKSYVQEKHQARDYARRSEASYAAETRRLRGRALLMAAVTFVATAALVVLVWWGAQAVFAGQVTAGQLTQFMVYALMGSNALSGLSEVWGSFQVVAGATERLIEILDTEPKLKIRENPVPMPKGVEVAVAFEQAHFSYESSHGATTLHGLSLAVRQGEKVALVGASGAGKTTVFALLQRFYDVTGGKVLVEGVDVRDLDPEALRMCFAYVEQEPTIFAGTVADNIRFGRPDADFEAVQAAAEAALVHDFVAELPDGYETVIGERGVTLSGGQKQRIAIARALIKDAPILLLDEATSALDARSERLVQTALERLMVGRTSLVIAHRLATIRNVDRILVLDKGRLIDQGSHDELVAKGGRYAELAKLQIYA